MAWGAVTGSLSGTVKDQTGLVIPGAKLTLVHSGQGVQTKTISDGKGFYSFPSLPVGQYDLQIEADGFKSEKRTGIVINVDSAVSLDATLQLAEKVESVTVAETEIHVETASTQLGEVVTGKAMTAVALNGRSFTDLLALQPGIVPMPQRSSRTPSSWPAHRSPSRPPAA